MLLKLLVFIFSIIVFFKNISYSIYEYKTNNNTIGAICIGCFSFITVVFLSIVLFIKI